MNKKILALVFIIPFITLLSWTGWLYIQQMCGKDVKVAVMGYDPRDLLSGHYIQYSIDWDKTDCSQFLNGVCPRDEFCLEAEWGRQCRFYIPEKNAEELDNLFRNRDRNNMIFEVIFSYHKRSEPIAKQLLINGKDWRESLNK